MKPDILLSVDLGQVSDPTAIMMAQRVELLTDWFWIDYQTAKGREEMLIERSMLKELAGHGGIRFRRWDTLTRYAIKELEQPPLGTRYPAIVDRVAEIEGELRARHPDCRLTLLVDATGCGRPVVDMMVEHGLDPVPITITAGERARATSGYLRVPKKDLVASLLILMGEQRIKFRDADPLAETLVTELQQFRMKKTKAGNDAFEAWRVGDHDDLVLAAAMLAWYGEEKLRSLVHQPPPPPLPLPKEQPLSFNQAMELARSRRNQPFPRRI